MELLSNHDVIKNKLIELTNGCIRMQVAVAWASTNHEVFRTLKNNKEKITKLIVGTHFYQTDPKFLEAFIDSKHVKVIKSTGEVFHPKIYYFQINTREWKCLIGSANFTNGAMNKNEEIMICISSEDYESESVQRDIWDKIQTWFNTASFIDDDYVKTYKKHYLVKQKSLQVLSSTTNNDKNYDNDIFSLSWKEYFNEISSSDKNDFEGRLKVIKNSQELFHKYGHFKDFSSEERKKIAGFHENKNDGIDWLWFGGMKGSGQFKEQINLNNPKISFALDQIPFHNTVTENDYLNFVDYFKQAFNDDKNRLATATRLLTMKRPDYFLCLDSKNKKNFCSDFGLSTKDITLENYWDTVIKKITNCLWWDEESIASIDNTEKNIWNSRVAFLDVLYFNNIPIANPKKYLFDNYPDIYTEIYDNKTVKVVSSRLWESKKNKDYHDNWWFKFSTENLNEFKYLLFSGAQDYQNRNFKLIKVPTSFLKNHLNDFDVNADGKMINLYISFDSYIDTRSNSHINFSAFIYN